MTTQEDDAMKLMILFCLNTKQKEKDGRFTIDCKKGLWGVSAPTKDQAQKEALHYFVQYLSDGEYDQPNVTGERQEEEKK